MKVRKINPIRLIKRGKKNLIKQAQRRQRPREREKGKEREKEREIRGGGGRINSRYRH